MSPASWRAGHTLDVLLCLNQAAAGAAGGRQHNAPLEEHCVAWKGIGQGLEDFLLLCGRLHPFQYFAKCLPALIQS